MRRSHETERWCRFLGVGSAEDAASELRRWIARLDDAHEAMTQVLKEVNCSPSDDIEAVVRISRMTLEESVQLIDQVIWTIRAGDPDVA